MKERTEMLVEPLTLKIAGNVFPLQPKKIKRWLQALPLGNMGETTRQLLEAIKTLNGQVMPPADRFEVMELMHPSLHLVLDHLERHFINRSLPLPPRSLQIAHVAEELQAESSAAYLRVIRDARGLKRHGLSSRHLANAIYQGMRSLSAQQLHAARLYLPVPIGTWQAMHELLVEAERHNLLHHPVTDDQLKVNTPERACLQAVLLALAAPLTLRQGESDLLYHHFETQSALCNISRDALPDNAGMLYTINLCRDAPPEYVAQDELDDPEQSRFLQITPLIRQLRDMVRTGNTQLLNSDLTHRVLVALTNTSRRRFSRAGQSGEIDVATGLNSIYQCVSQKMQAQLGNGDHAQDGYPSLSLQEIDGIPSVTDQGMSVHYLADIPKDTSSAAWDTVARGNLLTNGNHFSDNGFDDSRQSGIIPQPWSLVDTSAGGFRLRWKKPQAGRAQVGELLGLRDYDGTRVRWQLGVVRWMMFHPETGLEIGVQILAPRSLPVTIKRSRRRIAHGAALEGLVSPTIQVLQQPASLFCPAGVFQAGEEVAVNLAGRTLPVILTHKMAFSSRFEQFSYEPAPDDRKAGTAGDEQSAPTDIPWSSI